METRTLIMKSKLGLNSSPIEYSNSIKKNYQRVKLSGEFILISKYIFIA